MQLTILVVLVVVVVVVCHAQPDFSSVSVSENNTLVIYRLLKLPAPGPEWEWIIGDVSGGSEFGTAVWTHLCWNTLNGQKFQLAVTISPGCKWLAR